MSSSFRVRCGGCRGKLEVRPEACGLTIPCPTCGKTLSIPQTPPAPRKPKPKPTPSAALPLRETKPTVIQADYADAKRNQPPVVHPEVVQPVVVEPVVVEPAIVEPVVVEPVVVEAVVVEPELPAVDPFLEDAEAEERTAEEEALLNTNFDAVLGDPVPERKRESAPLPSRSKKGKHKQADSDEDGPYWQRQHGLRDDQRSSGFEFSATVIGGICTMFFGLVVLAAGLKYGMLIYWGPILIAGGFLTVMRGFFGGE